MTKPGDPPVKFCQSCFAVMFSAERTCPYCGVYQPRRKELERLNEEEDE